MAARGRESPIFETATVHVGAIEQSLVLEQGLSIADAIAIDSPPRGRTVDCSMDVCASPQRTPTVLIAPPPRGYFSCREVCGQHEKIEGFIHGSERCINDFWQLLDDVLD
jgi:hypothetical protein